MEFNQLGNLGKVELLQRHLLLKSDYATKEITLSEEEVKEIDDQLEKFRHLLSNVNLHKNTLKENGFSGLAQVIEELDIYYKDYK